MAEASNSLSLSVITRIEDEDLSSSFLDLRDNKSESNKTAAAIKQFNFFLTGYCVAKNFNHSDVIVHTDQIPYEGLEGIHGDFDPEKWWSDLIGNFFNYLAVSVYKYLNKDKGLIAYDSATGYASAIKVYFQNRFRHKPSRLVFCNPSWRKLRNLLLAKFKQRARRTGQQINTPKAASTDDDRKAMANASFWLGTAEAAEFHGLNVTVYHLCGRGREVSMLKPEDLSICYVNEDCHSYEVISVTLQRDKDGPLQELSLYPHRQSLQEDPYFCLIYSLLIGGCDKDDIFPKFSKEARIVNSNEKTESRVASFWTLCFNNLYKEFKSLSETVSDKLTCYHGRKGANQKLAETSSVSGLAQIFRTGWELRGFHTIFDYVIGSKTLSNQAGKALSGWTSKGDNKISGGVPPALTSIHSSQELVDDFVSSLFIEDIEDRWPTKIRNILVALLLRHYEEFINVIEEAPSGRYDDNSRHPLVHVVNKALRPSKVSAEILEKWCKEVKHGFTINNFLSLPVDLLPPDVINEAKVDPRSLFDHYSSLSSSYNGLFAQKRNLEENVSRLRADVSNLARSNQRLEKMVADQNVVLNKIAKVLEMKFDKQEPTIVSAEAPSYMLFSDTQKRWRKDFTLKEMFVRYFTDQCFEGYEIEKNGTEFKCKLPREKTLIKGQYKRLKRTIKVLLYFCDSYPKPIPLNDPASLAIWQRQLSSLADRAVSALLNELPKVPGRRVTPAFLAKSDIVKDWDNPESPLSKSFPKDTPDIIRAHFGLDG